MFSTTILAAPSIVYAAWTQPAVLNRWLTDSNHLDAEVGSSYLFQWNNGNYVAGAFTTLEADQKIVFTWRGKEDTVYSTVTVTLIAQDDSSTRVEVEHTGDGWEERLENLKYLLETGLDARLMRRPMLGIYPSELDPANKERLGIPVDQGMLLGGVLPGMGAEKAGLQKEDVIVTMDGRPVGTYNLFTGVVSTLRAGQTVAVEFYRGAEKHTVQMTLSERPKPEIPATVEGMAAKFEEAHAAALRELRELVADVPEEILSRRPEPQEWSVNEVLAHLTWGEKYNHISWWAFAGGEDNVPYPGNDAIHLAGILKVYPTSKEILAELERLFAGTAAIIRAMPENLSEQKSLQGVLAMAAEGSLLHSRSHHDQIRRAIENVKSEAAAV